MIIENNLLECDIIKTFMEKYRFPKELKINLVITSDMDKEYEKHLKKYNKEYDYISVFDYNGIICIPNNINEEITILINYERVQEINDKNYEVICTIFHELIHAKDYYNYFKQYIDGKYDSSIHRDSTYGFVNWSEFNAKKISYYEYCKLIHGEKLKTNEELKNIEENEIPDKNNKIDEILKDNDKDVEDIIYNLMLYLGRYSVWEELFPTVFNDGKKFSKELFKYKPIVDELYNLLNNNPSKMNDYEEIKKIINYIKGRWVNISSNK